MQICDSKRLLPNDRVYQSSARNSNDMGMVETEGGIA